MFGCRGWDEKELAVVIATLAGVTGAPAAEPVVRFPNTLTFYAAVTACLPPYFQCDYITNICTSGRNDGKQFAAGYFMSIAERPTRASTLTTGWRRCTACFIRPAT
jgi:hypothetical protein